MACVVSVLLFARLCNYNMCLITECWSHSSSVKDYDFKHYYVDIDCTDLEKVVFVGDLAFDKIFVLFNFAAIADVKLLQELV